MFRLPVAFATILLLLIAVLVLSLVLDFRGTLRAIGGFFDLRLFRPLARHPVRSALWMLAAAGLSVFCWWWFALPGDVFVVFFLIAFLIFVAIIGFFGMLASDLWEALRGRKLRESRRRFR
jgi:hypothetical protein